MVLPPGVIEEDHPFERFLADRAGVEDWPGLVGDGSRKAGHWASVEPLVQTDHIKRADRDFCVFSLILLCALQHLNTTGLYTDYIFKPVLIHVDFEYGPIKMSYYVLCD